MARYDQKFSIRKVTVGAASVVIGLAAGSAVANAADVETQPAHVQNVENANLGESIDLEKILEKAQPVATNAQDEKEVAENAAQEGKEATAAAVQEENNNKVAEVTETATDVDKKEDAVDKNLATDKKDENPADKAEGYSALRSAASASEENANATEHNEEAEQPKEDEQLKEEKEKLLKSVEESNIDERIKEVLRNRIGEINDLRNIGWVVREISLEKSLVDQKAKLLEELNSEVYYNYSTYKIPEDKIKELTNRIISGINNYNIGSISEEISEQKRLITTRVDALTRASKVNTKYQDEIVERIKNATSSSEVSTYNSIIYFIEEMTREEFSKKEEYVELMLNGEPYYELQKKYGWEAEKDLSYVKHKAKEFYFTGNDNLRNELREKIDNATDIEEVRKLAKQAQDFILRYNEVSTKINNLDNIDKRVYLEKAYNANSIEALDDILKEAIKKSEIDKELGTLKDQLREKAYRTISSYELSQRINNAETKEELEVISFDIDKAIFRTELENTSYPERDLAEKFSRRLTDVSTKEELEKLQEEYKLEKELNAERQKVSRYISENLKELDRNGYSTLLENAKSLDEIQKIKNEAKEKNEVLQGLRIEREQQNIENVMNYIEPLTEDQKEYIKNEMKDLYAKEYAKKEELEEKDNNGVVRPVLPEAKPSVRERVTYSVGNSASERELLTKIHYLYVLNTDNKLFTKEDFADLRERVLKSNSISDFGMIIESYQNAQRLERLESDEKEILKTRILNPKRDERDYENGPGHYYQGNQKEQFINSLDENKYLSKEEVTSYRKRLLADTDFYTLQDEITKLTQERELNKLLANLSAIDKEKITNLAKVDREATLSVAREYEKIDSYKNLTEADKDFFKANVKYYSSNYNDPIIYYREKNSAYILDKLYTLDIPKEEKEKLKKLIYQGAVSYRDIVGEEDLNEYLRYYKNKGRIESSIFSEETKNILLATVEKEKEAEEEILNENIKISKMNDSKVSRTFKIPDLNLDFKLSTLESLFSYSYIPNNKKLEFEKEVIATDDFNELTTLRAMHRALNEMLSLQPTQPTDNNIEPNKPVQPTDNNVEPNKPTQPTDNNVEPNKPVQPSDNNVEPNKPVQPTDNNVEPNKPVQPTQPTDNNVEPNKPTQPTDNNVEPNKPVDNKAEENKPVQPVEPSRPADNNSNNEVQPNRPNENNSNGNNNVEPNKPAEPTQPTDNNVEPNKPVDNKAEENKPAQPAEPSRPTDNNTNNVEPTRPEQPNNNTNNVVPTRPEQPNNTINAEQNRPSNNNTTTQSRPSDNTTEQPNTPQAQENLAVVTKTLGERAVEVAYDKTKVDADNVHLEKVEDAEVTNLILNKLGEDYTVLEVFEIHFEKDNKEVKSDAERTVSVSLVENNGRIEVYHIAENNELELVPSEVIDNKVYFTTNHFSKFTIVQAKGEKSVNKENVVLGVEYKKGQTITKKQLPNTQADSNTLAGTALTLLAGLLLATRRKER